MALPVPEAVGPSTFTQPVVHRVYARIGLLGNPSDGFGGAVISLAITNWWAEVTASLSPTLVLQPSPTHDPTDFSSLKALSDHVTGYGYSGGLRLLMASCQQFKQHCAAAGISLPDVTFTLSYITHIPRQAGLSGSSALVLATLRCLAEVHGVQGVLGMHDLPGLALRVERALGITAGLQDRVVQTYGGCVFMDFAGAGDGPGRYIAIDPALLPTLHLIYDERPTGKDSGQVHSTVKERWLEGNDAIRAGMAELAAIARHGLPTMQQGDSSQLADLMNRNFELRREMYGEQALGPRSLEMVRIARTSGAAAKFAGSGGSVVALCHGSDQETQTRTLQDLCASAGLTCVQVHAASPAAQLPAA